MAATPIPVRSRHPPPGSAACASAKGAGDQATVRLRDRWRSLRNPIPRRTHQGGDAHRRRLRRSGAYVVQVSAQRTEAEAQSSYQALQAKYPGVLGGREANIKRVDLGDEGGVFYRAQVGSFATSEQATRSSATA